MWWARDPSPGADVPRRVLRVVTGAVAVLLGALGALVLGRSPAALVAVVVLAVLAGVAVTAQAQSGATAAPARASRLPAPVRRGTTAAAGTAAALLVVVGIVGLLGPIAAYVLLPLLATAGLWGWSRHHADRADPPAARPVAAPPAPASRSDPATLSVPQLCRAWDRSSRLLRDLPAGPARIALAADRRRLLDELERRDPVGFHRWMHSGASADSDPTRYLTGNHSDTGGDPTPPPSPPTS